MGIFFYTHSVALIEDIQLDEEPYTSAEELKKDLINGYGQARGFIVYNPYSHLMLVIFFPVLLLLTY